MPLSAAERFRPGRSFRNLALAYCGITSRVSRISPQAPMFHLMRRPIISDRSTDVLHSPTLAATAAALPRTDLNAPSHPCPSAAPSAPNKKDDDLRPSPRSPTLAPLPLWLRPSGPMRKRRALALAAVCVLVYLFVHNLSTTLTPVAQRVDVRQPDRTLGGIPIPRFASPTKKKKKTPDGEEGDVHHPGSREAWRAQQERARGLTGGRAGPGRPERAPPRPKGGGGGGPGAGHYYDGDISFQRLATSLQALARTLGYGSSNRNVLFVAANPESVARLVPLACEMGRARRNVVHLAYYARDAVSVEELQEVNGAGDGCDIFWHGTKHPLVSCFLVRERAEMVVDARPDYAPWSTDARFEDGVLRALVHMFTFIHPQVYISDELHREDQIFVRALRNRVNQQSKTLIELPRRGTSTML